MTVIEFAIMCFRVIVWLGVFLSVIGVVLFLLILAFATFDPSIRTGRAGDAVNLLLYSPIVVIGGVFLIGLTFGAAALLLGIYDTQRKILEAITKGALTRTADPASDSTI